MVPVTLTCITRSIKPASSPPIASHCRQKHGDFLLCSTWPWPVTPLPPLLGAQRRRRCEDQIWELKDAWKHLLFSISRHTCFLLPIGSHWSRYVHGFLCPLVQCEATSVNYFSMFWWRHLLVISGIVNLYTNKVLFPRFIRTKSWKKMRNMETNIHIMMSNSNSKSTQKTCH